MIRKAFDLFDFKKKPIEGRITDMLEIMYQLGARGIKVYEMRVIEGNSIVVEIDHEDIKDSIKPNFKSIENEKNKINKG